MRTSPRWTDWTPHDPGVTVLTVLAWAIVGEATGLRRRLRVAPCGWRCALGVAIATAGAVVLLHDGRRRDPTPRRRPSAFRA